MKTVYKRIAVAIAALFVVSLSFLPFVKTAKAVNDNETSNDLNFNFTLVTIPVQYGFRPIGSMTAFYVTGPMRFKIYNTTTNYTGVTYTIDSLYTFGSSTGGFDNFLLNQVSIRPYFWYLPPSGATSNGIAFSIGVVLTITKTQSEEIGGALKSFTTGLQEGDSDFLTSFFVTFNFDIGFKTYIFDATSSTCTAYGQTVPLTTTIATISADGVASYNEGYNAGVTEGYNDGFTDGEKKGKGVGYNEGYSAGYLEGRDAPEYSFKEFFLGLGDAFVTIWTGMLNFEFLGVNIAGLIGTILVVCLVVFIVKIVKGA